MTEQDQLKAIRDGAPDGATHWSEAYKEYLKVNLVRKSFLAWEKDGEWRKSKVHEDFRSLSDTKARIELMEEIERLKNENESIYAMGAAVLFSGGVDSLTMHRCRELLAMRDKEIMARGVEEFLSDSKIPLKAKAGCIGEFKFTIEGANCCPLCWHKPSDDCELCSGQSGETGRSDLDVSVPWDIQKSIWKRINHFALSQLRNQVKVGGL
ncbi:hypothetical protein [Neptunicella sp.]|uniref:hypothetical protein n=1 Tax=Neptunicella sp. TaxID=2125986 RepID=UPI003F690E25